MPESEVEDKQERDVGTAHAAKALPSTPQKQVKPQVGVSSVAWQAVSFALCVCLLQFLPVAFLMIPHGIWSCADRHTFLQEPFTMSTDSDELCRTMN